MKRLTNKQLKERYQNAIRMEDSDFKTKTIMKIVGMMVRRGLKT